MAALAAYQETKLLSGADPGKSRSSYDKRFNAFGGYRIYLIFWRSVSDIYSGNAYLEPFGTHVYSIVQLGVFHWAGDVGGLEDSFHFVWDITSRKVLVNLWPARKSGYFLLDREIRVESVVHHTANDVILVGTGAGVKVRRKACVYIQQRVVVRRSICTEHFGKPPWLRWCVKYWILNTGNWKAIPCCR